MTSSRIYRNFLHIMDGAYTPVSLRDEKEKVASARYSSSDSESGSTATLLPSDDEHDLQSVKGERWSGSGAASGTVKWMIVGNGVFFVFSLMVLLRGLMYSAPTTRKFVEGFSAYSPAAHVIEYEEKKFNGSMYATSEYMGFGPEVDAAWDVITYNVGDQMISAAELVHIDKPSTAIQVTSPRTGERGYRVGIEVFHQLHCLNLLRQVSYWDYYSKRGGDFEEGIDGVRMHIDHCLEMLRMNLQCNSDIGLITFEKTDEGIWPDFSSWHTCRKFEKVLDWAMDNAVANDDPE